MLGLVVGGVVLSSAFRNAAEDSFDARLATDMDGLIAAAEPDPEGGVLLQDRFVNHQFDRVYSGLYYQIKPIVPGPGGQISRSLFDQVLNVGGNVRRGAVSYGFAVGPENQHLRVLSRRVEFPISATPDASDSRAYTFMVAGDLAAVDAESAAFNGTLFWSFLLLGLGLVAAVFLQVRVGLLPLRRLKEVVGRARTHVSNLAHFLKTPLSVLASEAESEKTPLADQVRRQVDTMRRQVDHYLARARAAGSVNVLGNRTPVAPVLSDLARVLTRIHAERAITIDWSCACKWAARQVEVRAVRDGARLVLTVADDGPGLTPENRARVGTRGERLDESVPGSGLGLAIVRDISKLYAGFLELDAAALGGLEARLILPAIQ